MVDKWLFMGPGESQVAGFGLSILQPLHNQRSCGNQAARVGSDVNTLQLLQRNSASHCELVC